MNGFVRLVAIIGVALLSACSSSNKAPAAKAPQELSELMARGATAEVDGLRVAALRRYEEAGQLYPTSKLPWLRIAHIQFDSGNYGEAIVAAQQVVARDDTDKVARSILSVSGLRVASKAVADLRTSNGLVGSVRNEAQELANVLRDSLGESVLVPTTTPAATTSATGTAGAAPTAPKQRTSTRLTTAPASAAASSSAPAPVQVRPAATAGSGNTAQSGSSSPFGSLK